LEQFPNKKSPWEKVAPQLVIDGAMQACFKDANAADKCIPFTTENGVIKSKTLKNALIK